MRPIERLSVCRSRQLRTARDTRCRYRSIRGPTVGNASVWRGMTGNSLFPGRSPHPSFALFKRAELLFDSLLVGPILNSCRVFRFFVPGEGDNVRRVQRRQVEDIPVRHRRPCGANEGQRGCARVINMAAAKSTRVIPPGTEIRCAFRE